MFLSRKYPSEKYSLHNFSFPGSILQRTIPYTIFPFQEVFFRELFPTIFFLSRKYPAENYSLQFFFLSRKYPAEKHSLKKILWMYQAHRKIKFHFLSLLFAYFGLFWLIFYYICLDLPHYVLSSPKKLVELITKHFWKSNLNKILEG